MSDLGPLFAWHEGQNTTPPDRPAPSQDGPRPSGSPDGRPPKSGTFLNDYVASGLPDGLAENPNDYRPSHVTPKGGSFTSFDQPSSAPSVPLHFTAYGRGAQKGSSCPTSVDPDGQDPDSDRAVGTAGRPASGGVLNGPIAPSLRPYQVEAIAGVREQFARGVRRTLLVLPTGSGKTVVFAELIRRVLADGATRALVLAHRTELLKQALAKLHAVGVMAAIEKAELRARHVPVVVASVQTLQGKRLHALRQSDFGLVVVDEAHHSMARSYRNVLEHFGATPVLGVTATPDRADGKALGELYESVAYQYELRAAIRDRWLAPIRARRVVVQGLDLSSVRTRAGDLAQDELAAIMNAEGIVQGIAGPLLEQAGSRPTVVFCVDVAGAHALAAVLNRHRGACARAIDGSADALERTLTLEGFARGEFQFLVNCALLTEGFDEPSIACVAMCRPTKSRALYTQCVGRGTRLHPGKTDCLLLDFVGNSGKHRLVGPIDALAPGDIAEDVYGEANDLLTDEGDVEQALLDAEESLRRKREAAAATVRARYFAADVDPFLGDEMPPRNHGDMVDERPATDEQIAQLEAKGFKRFPDGFSRGDASRILRGITERQKRGLSTLKQSQLLKRFHVDTRKLSFADANTLITFLVKHDYNARALESEMRRLESIARRSWQS